MKRSARRRNGQSQRDDEFEEETNRFHSGGNVGTNAQEKEECCPCHKTAEKSPPQEGHVKAAAGTRILSQNIDELICFQDAWLRYSAASLLRAR